MDEKQLKRLERGLQHPWPNEAMGLVEAIRALVAEVRRLKRLCSCGHPKSEHDPVECVHGDGCCGWVSAVGADEEVWAEEP